MFLLWPVLLATVMVQAYWQNLLSIVAYLAIVGMACVTTANTALFFSVMFRKTSMSLMTSYLVLAVLFCAPLAIKFFAEAYFPTAAATEYVVAGGVVSPFATAFATPFDAQTSSTGTPPAGQSWAIFFGHLLVMCIWNGVLLSLMVWLFNVRWRVLR